MANLQGPSPIPTLCLKVSRVCSFLRNWHEWVGMWVGMWVGICVCPSWHQGIWCDLFVTGPFLFQTQISNAMCENAKIHPSMICHLPMKKWNAHLKYWITPWIRGGWQVAFSYLTSTGPIFKVSSPLPTWSGAPNLCLPSTEQLLSICEKYCFTHVWRIEKISRYQTPVKRMFVLVY